MITGFNTDIEYKGVTYHVQTEDKGLTTPLILSLVYDRGTILASKRSPYDDLLVPSFDEKALSERLQKQHKLICAAVRAGRIEDLKRMTMKESASRQKGLIAQREIKSAAEKKEIPASEKTPSAAKSPQNGTANLDIPLPQILRDKLQSGGQLKEVELDLPETIAEKRNNAKIAKPSEDLIWDFPISVVEDDEPIIEAVQIIEEEVILPAEAVEIMSDFAKGEHASSAPDELKIALPEGTTFKGGERKTVKVLVHRGNNKKGLSNAQVMIKILGSSFRPLVFHAITDATGTATVQLQLPSFKGGRATVIIRAMRDSEEVELRQSIEQG